MLRCQDEDDETVVSSLASVSASVTASVTNATRCHPLFDVPQILLVNFSAATVQRPPVADLKSLYCIVSRGTQSSWGKPTAVTRNAASQSVSVVNPSMLFGFVVDLKDPLDCELTVKLYGSDAGGKDIALGAHTWRWRELPDDSRVTCVVDADAAFGASITVQLQRVSIFSAWMLQTVTKMSKQTGVWLPKHFSQRGTSLQELLDQRFRPPPQPSAEAPLAISSVEEPAGLTLLQHLQTAMMNTPALLLDHQSGCLRITKLLNYYQITHSTHALSRHVVFSYAVPAASADATFPWAYDQMQRFSNGSLKRCIPIAASELLVLASARAASSSSSTAPDTSASATDVDGTITVRLLASFRSIEAAILSLLSHSAQFAFPANLSDESATHSDSAAAAMIQITHRQTVFVSEATATSMVTAQLALDDDVGGSAVSSSPRPSASRSANVRCAVCQRHVPLSWLYSADQQRGQLLYPDLRAPDEDQVVSSVSAGSRAASATAVISHALPTQPRKSRSPPPPPAVLSPPDDQCLIPQPTTPRCVPCWRHHITHALSLNKLSEINRLLSLRDIADILPVADMNIYLDVSFQRWLQTELRARRCVSQATVVFVLFCVFCLICSVCLFRLFRLFRLVRWFILCVS
jgi:hypothetical protein